MLHKKTWYYIFTNTHAVIFTISRYKRIYHSTYKYHGIWTL